MSYLILRDLEQLEKELDLKKKDCLAKKEKYTLGDAWYGKAMGYEDAIAEIEKILKKYGRE